MIQVFMIFGSLAILTEFPNYFEIDRNQSTEERVAK